MGEWDMQKEYKRDLTVREICVTLNMDVWDDLDNILFPICLYLQSRFTSTRLRDLKLFTTKQVIESINHLRHMEDNDYMYELYTL